MNYHALEHLADYLDENRLSTDYDVVGQIAERALPELRQLLAENEELKDLLKKQIDNCSWWYRRCDELEKRIALQEAE